MKLYFFRHAEAEQESDCESAPRFPECPRHNTPPFRAAVVLWHYTRDRWDGKSGGSFSRQIVG